MGIGPKTLAKEMSAVGHVVPNTGGEPRCAACGAALSKPHAQWLYLGVSGDAIFPVGDRAIPYCILTDEDTCEVFFSLLGRLMLAAARFAASDDLRRHIEHDHDHRELGFTSSLTLRWEANFNAAAQAWRVLEVDEANRSEITHEKVTQVVISINGLRRPCGAHDWPIRKRLCDALLTTGCDLDDMEHALASLSGNLGPANDWVLAAELLSIPNPVGATRPPT